MTLRAELTLTRGAFELSVSLSVPEGGVLAVLGPNGAGKSTVLSCLAGLVRAERAHVRLGDRVLDGDGVRVPAHERGVGLLAQNALLFPHLSVLDNVAFSPRSRGASKAEARDVARRWLDEVDAREFADRSPAELSGGQAQRVGLARALAGEPGLLLLDEPLAALDVDAAPAVRGVLRRVLRGSGRKLATVLVTHDPLDALTLADHVAVLAEGRIVEQGPAREVLAAPRTVFTARLAGVNLVPGTATRTGSGAVVRTASGQSFHGVPARDLADGDAAVAVFDPGAVAVHPRDAEVAGSPRNVVNAVVTAVEPHGPVVRLRTREGISADLTPASVADLALEPGTPVRLAVKAAVVAVHAAPEPARGPGPAIGW
ncbi:ATP-binding cassette domain-containing protein [Saccharomonospora xinjiangensis]|uniref:sulfate/molybdate ABC transporter ATP-binding protein n=1 Tax=Saccharomonospora xinjiangensis TaxID=75294 RepID=UPI00107035F7|nr:ATP-binding cassette domain-containing protein [Saccharomonospora xinjiangensis]QBQ62126.1 Putative 2-aminoethylphosphonate import ATP-binding protein PhnT [Saccharomonospora xinjiangensis]